jgi:hypothetical protein
MLQDYRVPRFPRHSVTARHRASRTPPSAVPEPRVPHPVAPANPERAARHTLERGAGSAARRRRPRGDGGMRDSSPVAGAHDSGRRHNPDRCHLRALHRGPVLDGAGRVVLPPAHPRQVAMVPAVCEVDRQSDHQPDDQPQPVVQPQRSHHREAHQDSEDGHHGDPWGAKRPG